MIVVKSIVKSGLSIRSNEKWIVFYQKHLPKYITEKILISKLTNTYKEDKIMYFL